MGTTLTGIVQTFSPAGKHTVDYWHEVSTWEFGKNYELMMWLQGSGRATEGWPRDRGSHEDSYYQYRGDSQGERFWCGVELLETALAAMRELVTSSPLDEKYMFRWCSQQLEAMVAALRVLATQGKPVRVLFYKM